jgi:hypothetical protein
MGKSCSFRSTSCPRSKLNIGWIICIDIVVQKRRLSWRIQISYIRKSFYLIHLTINSDDALQRRQPWRVQMQRIPVLNVRDDIADNLLQRKCQLLALVVRVYVDQNQISNSGCKLNDNPFTFIVSVKSNSILGL